MKTWVITYHVIDKAMAADIFAAEEFEVCESGALVFYSKYDSGDPYCVRAYAPGSWKTVKDLDEIAKED